MSTHSIDGREWARLSNLKAGDRVELDDGFTCGIAGKTLTVLQDEDGLFVPCDGGDISEEPHATNERKHYLDGQISEVDNDHLVGIWMAE